MNLRNIVGSVSIILFVLTATPCFSAAPGDLRGGVEELASQLTTGTADKNLRIAVTDFPDLQGITSDLGRYIAERLTTRLSQNPRYSVIERRRLANIINELKFSLSDLVDPDKAKRLGKMLGVEALIVGSVSDLGKTVDVDARIINIETATTITSATTTISKDETVSSMMDRGREMTSENSASSSVPEEPDTSGTNRSGVYNYEQVIGKSQSFGFRVQIFLQSVRNDVGRGITFILFIENLSQDNYYKVHLLDPQNNVSLFDNLGNEYTLSSNNHLTADFMLEPLARQRIDLVFSPIKPNVRSLAFQVVFGGGLAKQTVFNMSPVGMDLYSGTVKAELKEIKLEEFK